MQFCCDNPSWLASSVLVSQWAPRNRNQMMRLDALLVISEWCRREMVATWHSTNSRQIDKKTFLRLLWNCFLFTLTGHITPFGTQYGLKIDVKDENKNWEIFHDFQPHTPLERKGMMKSRRRIAVNNYLNMALGRRKFLSVYLDD